MPGTQLIINADDFGLTPGINRAVAELYRAGALTSSTLMANADAFDDAVTIAREHRGLGVGCHIVLTDGIPVSHPEDIPTLLGADGKTFRPSLPDFLLAVLHGRVREDEIAREAMAQVQRLQRAGVDVTHLDTHKHTHILPRIARPLLFVAERARIGAIRNPFERSWSLAVSHSRPMRRLQVSAMALLRERFYRLPQIRSGAVLTTDGTIGISATGRLDETCVRELLTAMPPGLWELVCHPGYNDRELDQVITRLRATREVEREALLAVFANESREESPEASQAAIKEESHDTHLPRPQHIQRTHYGKLGSFGALRELGQFEPNTGHELLT